MTFHADVAETFTFTAKHIGNEFNGMYFPELREQGRNTGFCRVAGQISNKYFFQEVSLVYEEDCMRSTLLIEHTMNGCYADRIVAENRQVISLLAIPGTSVARILGLRCFIPNISITSSIEGGTVNF